ncbi:two-component sensor histidine kinase bacteria [Dorcoceras hygrometricum]|uniref:Two-component sensor histidine kinase bacteria n=1 Tax=Dorcoceras hygrometricum TaxID=472368 RepID=A0A2Z7CP14_9LAMI|nr:two-component sensor histidine kinase bacteria [Dorcoceras hygrometricum]
MVLEYKKLSQSFEKAKVERESCAMNAELVSSSNMKAALSKLETENEELRSRSEEMLISQSFEKAKVERESCAMNAELVSSSNMKAALSKLETENEELRSRSEEMLNENQRLAGIISFWT